jgi:hypothetical protein
MQSAQEANSEFESRQEALMMVSNFATKVSFRAACGARSSAQLGTDLSEFGAWTDQVTLQNLIGLY